MIETVLGVLIILYGTVYALFLLRAVWKDRANAAEAGDLLESLRM